MRCPAILILLFVFPVGVVAQEQAPSPQDIAKMLEQAKKYTEPGEKHKFFEQFEGKWDVETRFVMGGNRGTAEMGQAEFGWLMPGRWMKSTIKGKIMGRDMEGFMIMGYDNFKQSFVVTSVQDMDTAMNRSEGDLDQSGKTLITYGQMDEYLTGEHDKMVKYIWRIKDADTFVVEVHDLHIGEQNTMVIEQTFKRKQS